MSSASENEKPDNRAFGVSILKNSEYVKNVIIITIFFF